MKVYVRRIPLADVKLLDVNAHKMPKAKFDRLVENVRRDGCLTSAPFACIEPDGSYLVLSGNHRVKAGIAAGLFDAEFFVTDDALTNDERLAIQLSHNSLVGEDTPEILKTLYAQIEEIDLRAYSGLDDKSLDLVETAKFETLEPVCLDYQTVSFLFLPDERDRVKAALDKALAGIEMNIRYVARFSEYDRLLDALQNACDAYKIVNVSTALLLLLDIVERHWADMSDGYLDQQNGVKHKGSVPICTVLGSETLPATCAAKLKTAVERMCGRGEVPEHEKWRALENMVDSYLSE